MTSSCVVCGIVVAVVVGLSEKKRKYLPRLFWLSLVVFGSAEASLKSFCFAVAGETFILSDSFFLAKTLVSRLLRAWALVASVAKNEISQKKTKQ